MDQLKNIEKLCIQYAAARDALAEVSGEIKEERRKIVRARLRSLRARASAVSDFRAQLMEAIGEAREVFKKPRTRVLHGVKVGWRKQPGRISYSSAPFVIEKIRKKIPDRAPDLIRIRESLHSESLRKMSARELAAIGVAVEAIDDEIVVSHPADLIDQLVDVLIGEADEENV